MTRERHPVEDLTAFLDGALAADRAAEVRAHLARCPSCRELEARLRGAVATLATLPPSPDLPPFFAARLEARLRDERRRAGRSGLRGWLARLGGAVPHPRLALAGMGAAAVMAVAIAVGVRLHLRNRDDMLKDLDLLQEYETACALGVDTPEDAIIVAQLDRLERREATP